jgi:hypothetical protein
MSELISKKQGQMTLTIELFPSGDVYIAIDDAGSEYLFPDAYIYLNRHEAVAFLENAIAMIQETSDE